MKIEIAKEKDKEELKEFFKHYKNNKLIKNRVECYLKHNSTIIAKEDNKIVGVLQWHVQENPNAGLAEFEEVFVKEEFRGKGIGSKLVEEGIEEVRKFFIKNKIKGRKIFLFVGEDNPAARKLYEKHGFKFIAKLNELFSDKKKELFYCLDLQI